MRLYALRGFTLLELLVVLAIAALAAAAVGGGAQAVLEQSRYRQTIRDVSTFLKQARAVSVRDGRRVTVRYVPDARQLQADGLPSFNVPQELEVTWQAPGSPAQQNAPLFIFEPDGGAIGGALRISRGAGDGVVFRVNWLLGSVEQASARAGA